MRREIYAFVIDISFVQRYDATLVTKLGGRAKGWKTRSKLKNAIEIYAARLDAVS